MKTRHFAAAALVILVSGLPVAAQAYVGPGAGLSLAAAFWAVLVAVGTIMAFTLMWPVRRLLRRRNAQARHRAAGSRPAAGDPAHTMHDRSGHRS